MKKTLLIFTAGVLLTGCGTAGHVSGIQSENETAAVTGPFTGVLTDVPETSASATVIAAETETTAAAAAEKSADEKAADAPTEDATTDREEFESELYTTHEEKVPPEERAALDKLREKYGKDFTFVARELPWEFFDGIPDVKPVTYYLTDDEGRKFTAVGMENSEDLTSESYAYLFHQEELYDHARDHIRSYTQAGKLWIMPPNRIEVPFDSPAYMTFEEYLSYFCQQEGKIFADIFLPEGTELPEELISDDWRNTIYIESPGYRIGLGVYYLPQKDYDRIDDLTYGDINVNHDHMRSANE